jgi:hypothetical protein
MHGLEVVMDHPAFDEGTMVRLDKLVHEGGQPGRQGFGNQFANAVDQTNWPKVRDLHRFILLP